MNGYVSDEMMTWKAKMTALTNQIESCQTGIRELNRRIFRLNKLRIELKENKPKE